MPRKMLVGIIALAAVAVSNAQFTSLITDFDFDSEGVAFIPFSDQPMFLKPLDSSTTRGVAVSTPPQNTQLGFAGDGFSVVNSAPNALFATWEWTDPSFHTSWIRLSTAGAEYYPSPALHLGGKVRISMSAKAWQDTFATPATGANLLVGIGVRETGFGLPMGADGGTAGDVEWLADSKLIEITAGPDGIVDSIVDPNSDDIQVNPVSTVGSEDTVCISAGPDGVMQSAVLGDDVTLVTPVGFFTVPADGVMRTYEFDLPALELSGNVFSFTGDGSLGATPNNRGTLDHLIITNDPANGAANAVRFLLNIDDVEFEAPIPDPPVFVTDPNGPTPLGEEVDLLVDQNATFVELYSVDRDGNETLLGSGVPASGKITISTPPLAAGLPLVARQTVDGVESDNSSPFPVASPGNGPLGIAMAVRETRNIDTGKSCGDIGTGFDPDNPSTLEFVGASGTSGFGNPDARRYLPQAGWFEVQFNPCDPTYGVFLFSGNGELDLDTTAGDATESIGVWEGLYFRIDQDNPAVGPYTVYIDDLAVKDTNGNIICLVDDFESYRVADFILEPSSGNGQSDSTASGDDQQIVSSGSPAEGGQIVVDPGNDDILDSVPGGDDFIDSLHARFNNPGVAGTSQGLALEPDATAVTEEQAYSGSKSLKVQWAYLDAANDRSVLRLTTNKSITPPSAETFLNGNPVMPIELDGELCDGTGDVVFSVMIRLEPPEVPGDCDVDGDVDMHDIACAQVCTGSVVSGCETFDVAPKNNPDGIVDGGDYMLVQYLVIGPIQ